MPMKKRFVVSWYPNKKNKIPLKESVSSCYLCVKCSSSFWVKLATSTPCFTVVLFLCFQCGFLDKNTATCLWQRTPWQAPAAVNILCLQLWDAETKWTVASFRLLDVTWTWVFVFFCFLLVCFALSAHSPDFCYIGIGWNAFLCLFTSRLDIWIGKHHQHKVEFIWATFQF